LKGETVSKNISELTKPYCPWLQPDFDLKECAKNRQREYVPLIRMPIDIMDRNANVLIKAGTFINPLEKGLVFNAYIVFINADDPVQRVLAKMLKSKAAIIVVKGDMQKLFKEGVFAYRADKALIENLNLECVPSVYTQKNNTFLINEYNPKELIGKK
jgi:hypothetical protein